MFSIFGVIGFIPEEIGDLQGLKEIDFRLNRIRGVDCVFIFLISQLNTWAISALEYLGYAF